MSDDQTKVLSNGDDKLDRIIELMRQQTLKIDDLTAAVKGLDSRLTALESSVDERLKDTRPLWEGVQAQIAELREEVQTGFRRVAQRLDVVSVDINNVRADIHDHETRLTRLEDRP